MFKGVGAQTVSLAQTIVSTGRIVQVEDSVMVKVCGRACCRRTEKATQTQSKRMTRDRRASPCVCTRRRTWKVDLSC